MELDGPHWPDRCGHGGYVGTFECWETKDTTSIYDLYVFDGKLEDQQVCMRYGAEDGQYCSPGDISDVMRASSGLERYRLALLMLQEKGRIVWQPT